MNPFTSLKTYLWAVCVAAIIGSYFWGHHKGHTLATLEQEAVIAKLNEEARAKEQAHTEAINDIATQLTKEKQNAKAANDNYRAAVRAGTERMYVNVRPVQAGPSATPATGDRNEARAELDPATAEELVGITSDGDDAIRQLNACIDAYNELRK
jgi:prophage endopeptidase